VIFDHGIDIHENLVVTDARSWDENFVFVSRTRIGGGEKLFSGERSRVELI
jgi:hypothetical protein